MKIRNLYLILLAAALSAAFAPAPLLAQETLRRYATQTYMQDLASRDAELHDRRSAIERHTAEYMSQGQPDTVTIAVVFHLLQYPGQQPPTERDIMAQLARLNHDFFAPPPLLRAELADSSYLDRATAPHIRFCLPASTPQGFPGRGIVTAAGAQTAWPVAQQDLKSGEKGGSTAWDPQHYLNVWVAPLADGVAGYAQMPGAASATDGIVISPQYFAKADTLALYGMTPLADSDTAPYGRPEGGLGRTLVHLVGNYLNLYDLWNDGQPCTDDYVWDTPVHNAPNYGQPRYKHISLCKYEDEEAYPTEMTMNLMDNTDDAAQYMFTRGQVRRMHAALAPGGPRAGLRNVPTDCDPGLQETWTEARKQDPSAPSPVFSLSAFPNPSAGAFVLDIATGHKAAAALGVQVFNTLGELVWAETRPAFEGSILLQVDAAQWPVGFYTVKARHGQQQQIVKVLLERK